MTIEKSANRKIKKKPSVEDITLPQEFINNSAVSSALAELFSLASAVLDASSAQRAKLREKFESQLDHVLDHKPEAAKFLLSDHPSHGVNWIGYLRHLYGPILDGKATLPPRDRPRGVSSKSGR